jgi:GT2 family glycosyltransferase
MCTRSERRGFCERAVEDPPLIERTVVPDHWTVRRQEGNRSRQPMSSQSADKSTIIICCYTEDRWSLLLDAIKSVPVREDAELIVVVDHNPRLLERLKSESLPCLILPNQHERGISGARNTGLARAMGDLIVFLDDDAVGRPGWLDILLGAFDDPHIVVAGGSLHPRWEDHPSDWHPKSFYWVFGCSWLGLPTVTSEVRNVIGACMAIRKTIFESLGGFSDKLGRQAGAPLGCDETELCIRAGTMGGILYVPSCLVDHYVSRQRVSLKYFVLRCWSEGASKAVVATLVGSHRGLSEERKHLLVMWRETTEALRGRQFRRASAVALGGATTLGGYLWTRASVVSSRVASWSVTARPGVPVQ